MLEYLSICQLPDRYKLFGHKHHNSSSHFQSQENDFLKIVRVNRDIEVKQKKLKGYPLRHIHLQLSFDLLNPISHGGEGL